MIFLGRLVVVTKTGLFVDTVDLVVDTVGTVDVIMTGLMDTVDKVVVTAGTVDVVVGTMRVGIVFLVIFGANVVILRVTH